MDQKELTKIRQMAMERAKQVKKKAQTNTVENTQAFDPRALDDDGKTQDVVWSTESVNIALEAIKNGQRLRYSPFFEGNVELRKANLVYKYTEWELQELKKCMISVPYFIENYIKVKGTDGKLSKVKLRDYQWDQIDILEEFKRVLLSYGRQSGKTMGVLIKTLHDMIFKNGYKAGFLANKGSTTKDIIKKFGELYRNLPFFLKAGIVGWSQSTITFDNKSGAFGLALSLDALNGTALDLCYIDEFAFCFSDKRNKVEMQKEFLANSLPVLSSTNGQLIISSTPNSMNCEFYNLVNTAKKGENDFKLHSVYWWNLPHRSIEWALSEIKSIGLDKFRIQYENCFSITSNDLLSSKVKKRLTKNKTKFQSFDILGEHSKYLKIDPDFRLKKNDVFLHSVDLAEGLKQDYTVNQIMQLRFRKAFKTVKGKRILLGIKPYLKQVAVFRCNTLAIDEFAPIMGKLFNIFNPDYSKMLVEMNNYGEYFLKCMDMLVYDDIDLASYCKFKRSADAETSTRGLRINKQTKRLGAAAWMNMMEIEEMDVRESETIDEISNFKENEKGSYEAEIGHDDTVMPLLNASYFMTLDSVEKQNFIEDAAEIKGIDLEHFMTDQDKKYEMEQRMSDKEAALIAKLPENVRRFLMPQ